jgi:hypothetical protein
LPGAPFLLAAVLLAIAFLIAWRVMRNPERLAHPIAISEKPAEHP